MVGVRGVVDSVNVTSTRLEFTDGSGNKHMWWSPTGLYARPKDTVQVGHDCKLHRVPATLQRITGN